MTDFATHVRSLIAELDDAQKQAFANKIMVVVRALKNNSPEIILKTFRTIVDAMPPSFATLNDLLAQFGGRIDPFSKLLLYEIIQALIANNAGDLAESMKVDLANRGIDIQKEGAALASDPQTQALLTLPAAKPVPIRVVRPSKSPKPLSHPQTAGTDSPATNVPATGAGQAAGSGDTTGRAPSPLEFHLWDDRDQPVLSTMDPAGQILTLHLSNSAGKQIALQNPGPAVDAQTAHITLRFRKGTIKQLVTTPAPAGWSLASKQTNSEDHLLLRSQQPLTLAPDQKVSLALPPLQGDPDGGTRFTRVAFGYANMRLAGAAADTPDLSGVHQHAFTIAQIGAGEGAALNDLQTQLAALSSPGPSLAALLQVNFVSDNVIICDGATPNTLVIELTNVAAATVTGEKGATLVLPAKCFTLWADFAERGQVATAPLGTTDQARAIGLTTSGPPPATWAFEVNDLTGRRQWRFPLAATSNSSESAAQANTLLLEPGESIRLVLTNIVSDWPARPATGDVPRTANLYLSAWDLKQRVNGSDTPLANHTWTLVVGKSQLAFMRLGGLNSGAVTPDLARSRPGMAREPLTWQIGGGTSATIAAADATLTIGVGQNKKLLFADSNQLTITGGATVNGTVSAYSVTGNTVQATNTVTTKTLIATDEISGTKLTLTGQASINTNSNPALTLTGNDTLGSWLRLDASNGGIPWNIISTGAGNGEGSKKLIFYTTEGGANNATRSSPLRLSHDTVEIADKVTRKGHPLSIIHYDKPHKAKIDPPAGTTVDDWNAIAIPRRVGIGEHKADRKPDGSYEDPWPESWQNDNNWTFLECYLNVYAYDTGIKYWEVYVVSWINNDGTWGWSYSDKFPTAYPQLANVLLVAK